MDRCAAWSWSLAARLPALYGWISNSVWLNFIVQQWRHCIRRICALVMRRQTFAYIRKVAVHDEWWIVYWICFVLLSHLRWVTDSQLHECILRVIECVFCRNAQWELIDVSCRFHGLGETPHSFLVIKGKSTANDRIVKMKGNWQIKWIPLRAAINFLLLFCV